MAKLQKIYFDTETKFKEKPLKYYLILLIIAVVLWVV
jgi:hypothetical protein